MARAQKATQQMMNHHLFGRGPGANSFCPGLLTRIMSLRGFGHGSVASVYCHGFGRVSLWHTGIIMAFFKVYRDCELHILFELVL